MPLNLQILDLTNSNFNSQQAVDDFSTFLTAGGIVAPPGVLQISSFKFDYEGDDSVSLRSEITKHWVEDNVAAEDHIGIEPVTIRLKGRVSELSFSAATAVSINAALAAVENGLSQADAYLGAYTPGTTQTLLNAITQAQNISVQIEQAAARLQQLASFFPSSGPQRNKQQTAFAILSALRNARVLFTVYTPFQVFYNMAILSIEATQPAATKTISDFTVEMMQLQFTNSLSQASFQSQYGGRAAAGYQPPTSNGITTGVTKAVSDVTTVFSNNSLALNL